MSNLETKDLHAETRRARRAIFLIPTLFSAASAPPREKFFFREITALDAVTEVHAETRRARRKIFLIPTLSSAVSAPPREKIFFREIAALDAGFQRMTGGLYLAVLLALEVIRVMDSARPRFRDTIPNRLGPRQDLDR